MPLKDRVSNLSTILGLTISSNNVKKELRGAFLKGQYIAILLKLENERYRGRVWERGRVSDKRISERCCSAIVLCGVLRG